MAILSEVSADYAMEPSGDIVELLLVCYMASSSC